MFGVLDIDAKSKYHNHKQLHNILEILKTAGLTKTCLYRSSYSGGWHLYIFFEEKINSRELQESLSSLLKLSGLEVAKGKLEVFPNPGYNSAGMGLRLPLQPGWAWLDAETLEVVADRNDLSATEALEKFIDELNGWANTFVSFQRLKVYVDDLSRRHEKSLAIAKKEPPAGVVVPFTRTPRTSDTTQNPSVTSIFGKLPPGINADDWLKGRDFYDNGLQGPGQRADAIFCLGHYLFYGDPSRYLEALGYGYEQDRDWLIEEILSTKHNGFSDDINHGRGDAFAQVHRATHWIPPHRRGQETKAYKPEVPIAWTRNSANLKAGARKRIRAAFDELVAAGSRFTIREFLAKAKCHHQTLEKHSDLWKVEYDQFHERLANVACEYNAVVGVSSPETQPPTTVFSKTTPPGLLAARRLVFEMNRRWAKEKQEKTKQDLYMREQAEGDWRESILDRVPEDLPAASTHVLRVLITFLSWRLSHSPSHEDEVWVRDILVSVRKELESSKRQNPTTLDSENKHPP